MPVLPMSQFRRATLQDECKNGLPAIQFADDYLAMSNGDSAPGWFGDLYLPGGQRKLLVRIGYPFSQRGDGGRAGNSDTRRIPG